MSVNLVKLKESYDKTVRGADAFGKALTDQLTDLLEQNSLRPAIPIENRTKEWSSILVKLDRLAETWDDVKQIWDFVGLRVVFLFPEQTARACALVENNFTISYRDDKGHKLSPHEFGYKSVHFTVRLRPEWSRVPTLRNYADLQAEIQIRTLAQHNWAVAARILQYNDQSFAPPSVQRSLFRVAALLELVDLELGRVQTDRDSYKAQVVSHGYDQTLNVDLLVAILSSFLPDSHRIPNDKYSDLLFDLNRCGVSKGTQVIDLIHEHLEQALANDRIAVEAIRSGNSAYENDPIRLEKGVFYSHVGLIQNILNLAYGPNWRKISNVEK